MKFGGILSIKFVYYVILILPIKIMSAFLIFPFPAIYFTHFILLKREKQGMGMWNSFTWHRIVSSVGDFRSETSSSVKGGKFLYQLGKYYSFIQKL